ncbi:hypothetical protein RchiOBHm_Chr5g0065001 [Rosa chinensis]|uniref:Uncharacterized protein n=1 Tax=Rosa chinensis TaxID=74649 RepID=A0A2P6QIU0_ROSCH|nr:hypothetical protein RchiOBHm_Chr5g0065001 [Rosa chinensis]
MISWVWVIQRLGSASYYVFMNFHVRLDLISGCFFLFSICMSDWEEKETRGEILNLVSVFLIGLVSGRRRTGGWSE